MMPRTWIDIIPHLDYAELNQRYRRCRDVKERTRWFVPKDIIMYSLPPYTPQLNPTECIWPLLRERLANQVFHTLDSLETVLIEHCQWLMNNPTTVKGKVGFSWLCSI